MVARGELAPSAHIRPGEAAGHLARGLARRAGAHSRSAPATDGVSMVATLQRCTLSALARILTKEHLKAKVLPAGT